MHFSTQGRCRLCYPCAASDVGGAKEPLSIRILSFSCSFVRVWYSYWIKIQFNWKFNIFPGSNMMVVMRWKGLKENEISWKSAKNQEAGEPEESRKFDVFCYSKVVTSSQGQAGYRVQFCGENCNFAEVTCHKTRPLQRVFPSTDNFRTTFALGRTQ